MNMYSAYFFTIRITCLILYASEANNDLMHYYLARLLFSCSLIPTLFILMHTKTSSKVNVPLNYGRNAIFKLAISTVFPEGAHSNDVTYSGFFARAIPLGNGSLIL